MQKLWLQYNCELWPVCCSKQRRVFVTCVCDNGEKRPAENNEPFLTEGGIMSLYQSNALTGQVDVLMAEI